MGGRCLCLLCVAILFSCSKEAVPKVYRLAKVKERVQPSIESSIPLPPSPSQPIKWKLPIGWKSLPASGMRIASFSVEGVSVETIDVSLIFLGGVAGGDLANVNRWRDQINLGAWTEKQFLESSVEEVSGIGNATVVDFVNGEGVRMVAAIIPYGKGTWFLKMLGEDLVVKENTPKFIALLNSLVLANG